MSLCHCAQITRVRTSDIIRLRSDGNAIIETMITCPTCYTLIDERSPSCPECGQLFCQACHEPVANDAASCPFCNEQLTMQCAGCKRDISRAAAFCPECGRALHKAGPIRVPEYTRIRRDADGPEDDAFNGACPSCAAELYVEDGFCSECGQALCAAYPAPPGDYGSAALATRTRWHRHGSYTRRSGRRCKT